jgi:hypothetical protein
MPALIDLPQSPSASAERSLYGSASSRVKILERGAAAGPGSPSFGRARPTPTLLILKAVNDGTGERADTLYFFPDRPMTEADLRLLLATGGLEDRAWAIAHLLRYAQWDDIWTYVSRDEVRELFPQLDLPESLRAAWGRVLKVETPVG